MATAPSFGFLHRACSRICSCLMDSMGRIRRPRWHRVMMAAFMGPLRPAVCAALEQSSDWPARCRPNHPAAGKPDNLFRLNGDVQRDNAGRGADEVSLDEKRDQSGRRGKYFRFRDTRAEHQQCRVGRCRGLFRHRAKQLQHGVQRQRHAEVLFSPPIFTSQPTNQNLTPGATAIFGVNVVGSEPLTYQWRVQPTNAGFQGGLFGSFPMNLTDGGNISGSTTSTLTINNAIEANSGVYSVVVSNPLTTVASSSAVLSVMPSSAPGTVLGTIHLFAGGVDGSKPSGLTLGSGWRQFVWRDRVWAAQFTPARCSWSVPHAGW